MSRSPSKAFPLLHPSIQRWIWKQGWNTLRDIQEQAVESILTYKRDVIISASTAGGKTEAAFLPAISEVLQSPSEGVAILGIIPLKALINDQYHRLENILEGTSLPLFAWHGDISATKKLKALSSPSSILLITPESLEALFVRRHAEVKKAFPSIKRIVVDELHAFIGTERGIQLQSLMHRVDQIAGTKVPRIGLSATLGDMSKAIEFLRHDNSLMCDVIKSQHGGRELKVQIRGYTSKKADLNESKASIWQAIGKHLYTTLRGSNNLTFANSRHNVELLSDKLRRICENANVPNEFFPHHGSLSKEIREEAEERLKKHQRPTTVISTSTLELGVDIGSVKSVAQIGAPPSVSSLCQRIGRSGRQEGNPAILRTYIYEEEWDASLSLADRLRLRTVQATAMVQLLIKGWNEPPVPNRLHLSTLIQQLLSLIAQHGGMNPAELWNDLCKTGPFFHIDVETFKHLLRVLASHEILMQTGEGTILLGENGEQIVEHYSFYAAFISPEEVNVIADGNNLGSLTTAFPIVPKSYLIFAGKRWLINSFDEKRKVVLVSPAIGGELPKFDGGCGAMVHDKVREEMKKCLESDHNISFLNLQAAELLSQARRTYSETISNSPSLIKNGSNTSFLIWKGDRICFTIFVMLQKEKLEVEQYGPVFTIRKTTPSDLSLCIKKLLAKSPLSPTDLAHNLEGKGKEKFDFLLDEHLLNATCGVGTFDIKGARKALAHLINN